MRFPIKSIIWNGYWAIIGMLTALFVVLGVNPLFLVFILLVLFSLSTFVGNIFVVKTVWRPKPTLSIFSIFIVLFIFESILELKDISLAINSLSTALLSISIIVISLIKESGGHAISTILLNWKKFCRFYKEYLFKFSSSTMFGWVLEIVLIISMFIVFPNSLSKYFMIFFWAISGPLFIMLGGTTFILKEPLEDVMQISQIYGTSRMTYFLFLFYNGATQMNIFGFALLFSLTYFGFLSSLIPYITKSKELRDSIKVIRYLYNNKRSKVSHISLANGIDSNDSTLDLLRRLQFHRFVEPNDNGKRWSLKKNYLRKIR